MHRQVEKERGIKNIEGPLRIDSITLPWKHPAKCEDLGTSYCSQHHVQLGITKSVGRKGDVLSKQQYTHPTPIQIIRKGFNLATQNRISEVAEQSGQVCVSAGYCLGIARNVDQGKNW